MNDSPWASEVADDTPDKTEHFFRAAPIRHGADPSLPEFVMFEIEVIRGGKVTGAAHIEMNLEQLEKTLVDLLAIRRWMRFGRAGDQQRRERMRNFMRSIHPGARPPEKAAE